MQQFLSRHQRWTAPVFIAGESYGGGFRVAKLARLVQERYGIGLNGAILISPAIEFASILGSDYDLMHWVELLPTMAAPHSITDAAPEKIQARAAFSRRVRPGRLPAAAGPRRCHARGPAPGHRWPDGAPDRARRGAD